MNTMVLTLGDYATNCYILWQEGRRDCLVVDPGYQPQVILEAVRAKGLHVAAVLLTHGHFDHVGGVEMIARMTHCPVYIHEGDLLLPTVMTGGPLYTTDHYTHGEQLELAGLKCKVHHTPGHTPGSVCLEFGDTLLTGDTLFAGSIGRTDFPGSHGGDMRQSLLYLAGLKKNFTIYPGHGASSTLEREKKTNPFLR